MEELLACRVCLATDVYLYDIIEYRLQDSYNKLTGHQIDLMDGLPKHLCNYCVMLLKKCVHFKEKSSKTQDLLVNALKSNYVITTNYIRSIDKTALQLTFFTKSPILITEYPTIDVKEECDTKDNISIDSTEIKQENDHSDEEPLSKKVKKRKKRKKKGVIIKIENEQNGFILNDSEFNVDLELNDSQNELEFNDMDFNETDNNDVESEVISGNDTEVVILTREQQIEEVQARKESFNYRNSFYRCEKCFKGFLTDGTYQNHMTRHDIKCGPHNCDICQIRWPDRRSLRAHKIISHERKFICKICDHVTKSNHRAKEHSKWHNGFKFDCKLCSASFAKSTSYFTHVRMQHPSKYCCDVCGESFIGENGLNMHRKKAHRNGEKSKLIIENQCLQCGVQFKNMDALKQHTSLAQEHICNTMLRPCVFCGLSFASGEEFSKHAKTHQNRVAARCEQCDRNFVHERSFAIHNQRVHLGLKHKYKKPELKRKAAVVCEICGKKCISNATLVYHQRTHTGEKPYNCTECPKSFSVYQRLQIHIRTHTGERPYKCTHCPKAFKHKAALNRHDRVHSGAKPYQCPHCGKSFSQSNSMKLHVKTVHLKMPAPYRSRRNNKTNE